MTVVKLMGIRGNAKIFLRLSLSTHCTRVYRTCESKHKNLMIKSTYRECFVTNAANEWSLTGMLIM